MEKFYDGLLITAGKYKLEDLEQTLLKVYSYVKRNSIPSYCNLKLMSPWKTIRWDECSFTRASLVWLRWKHWTSLSLRTTLKYVNTVTQPIVDENAPEKNKCQKKTFQHMSVNCEYALQWELVTMSIHSKTTTWCQWTHKSPEVKLTTNREFPALGIFARSLHKDSRSSHSFLFRRWKCIAFT
jgi:hypothetical protein